MSRFVSPGQQKELINDLFDLHSKDLSKQIAVLNRAPNIFEEEISQRTAPLPLLEQAALGALTYTVSTALPSDEDLENSPKAIGASKVWRARQKLH